MSSEETPRPCERKCAGPCGLWKHHSRFAHRRRRRKTPNGTVWEFDAVCRDCQQKARNERKNVDRAAGLIRQRAAQAARKAGTTTEFFMTAMNYQSLVPIMRAMMSAEGLCLACGHSFVGESDIQIEHIEPPRSSQDWARLHTRNLRLFCRSCNQTKSDKPYVIWLDEQELARLSNLKSHIPHEPPGVQLEFEL